MSFQIRWVFKSFLKNTFMAALCCVALLPQWLFAAQIDGMYMHVGETRVIRLPSPIDKVAIGNGKVLSTATVAPTELLMIANDAGESSLYLWLKDGREIHYTVQIGANNPSRTFEQIKRFFNNDENIVSELIGDRVFLQGNHLTVEQERKVAALLKAFPNQIVPVFGADSDLQERTVFIHAQVVEIKKSSLEQLGINWNSGIPDAISAGLEKSVTGASDHFASTTFTSSLNLAAKIAASIDLLQEKGDAYLVAAPHLTARCGGKADFTSGGELPVPIPNGGFGQVTVEYKPYGIRLAIEPVCDKRGNIRAKLTAEVSQIDGAVTVMGVPGLLTRKAESELDLIDGKSMLLSGLSSLQASESVHQMPGLGNLPVLGHLFKSNYFNGERSELVIVITPSFVAPESETVKSSVQRRDKISDRAEEKLVDEGIKPFKDIVPSIIELTAPDSTPASSEAPSDGGDDDAAARTIKPAETPSPDAAKEGEGIQENAFSKAINGAVVELQPVVTPAPRGGNKRNGAPHLENTQDFQDVAVTLGFDPQILQVLSIKQGNSSALPVQVAAQGRKSGLAKKTKTSARK
jgi:pilus assembly protein CpaC